MRSFGPFGVEKGHYFCLSSLGGKITGFFGRSGDSLDALGAHMTPIQHNLLSLGPYGGKGGMAWDDGSHSGIRRIKVAYGDVVDSLTFEYDDNVSSKHGGDGGKEIETITLDYPEEYLISVSGFYLEESPLVTVSSLVFQSNKRVFKPIGRKEGRYFSFPSFSGKIVGFFGRSGSLLDSLGGYVLPVSSPATNFFVEPLGGQGGKFWDDGAFTGVRGMEIGVGPCIQSIAFEYDNNGRSVWSHSRESSSPVDLCKVELDYPSEFILSVRGHYCSQTKAICSLTMETNKKTFGPFGRTQGEEFELSPRGGKVVGFTGRSDNHLNALGLYTRSLPTPSYYEPMGPFGGIKGGLWDHGVYTGIRQIEVYVGEHYINAFRVEYDAHGRSEWSSMRGGIGPQGFGIKHVVEFDYPYEFLVSVSGHYNIDSGHYIRSLAFKTNRRDHLSFGHPDGDFFKFPHSDGMIVGFHGRSGWYIDSIGAYVVALPSRCYPSEYLVHYGGEEGKAWDDGVHDTVRNITLVMADHGLEFIKFDYDRNGRLVSGKPHGQEDPSAELIEIELDYPNEFLIAISGFFDSHPSSPSPRIQSLTFYSNKNAYGPYGHAKGEPFSSQGSAGKVVGFHGKVADNFVSSLGLYLKPISD